MGGERGLYRYRPVCWCLYERGRVTGARLGGEPEEDGGWLPDGLLMMLVSGHTPFMH